MPPQQDVRVCSMPYAFDVAQGNIKGVAGHRIIGYNGSVSGTLEDVTELGVNVTPVPVSATAMEVMSTHADDNGNSGGAGARTVMIHGLDANWTERAETITLNGISAVACIGTYRRVNSFHVMTVGSDGVAAGDIKVRASGADTEYARISAGGNMMLQCHFTVPAGKTACIIGWSASSVSTGPAITRIILRATCDWKNRWLIPDVFHFQDIMMFDDGTTVRNFGMPLLCPAMCDIKVSAQRISGGTAHAAASVELWIE